MSDQKHWFMMLEINALLGDPELNLCADATFGIWVKSLGVMHSRERSDRLIGTVTDLAKLARTTFNAMRMALDDLNVHGAADLLIDGQPPSRVVGAVIDHISNAKSNAVVTLICRRMSREAKRRNDNALRQRRRRSREPCHGNVTDDVTPHTYNDNNIENPQPPNLERGSRHRPGRPRQLSARERKLQDIDALLDGETTP